jgi:hypothetical protein
MALSLSTERTVLWDQITYAGNPEEFAWVLPVKPGAYLELGADAFFEALDTGTAANIVSPSISCPVDNGGFAGGYGDDGYYDDYGGSGGPGCGCSDEAYGAGTGDYGTGGAGGGAGAAGSGGEPAPDPVTVVHQESIGPYETVTIHSNIPGSLFVWLDMHGYAVDESVKPVIDDYENEGFDFIALRLIPGANVQQMQPVRVISPGAAPVLPLRMVAAGTGANVALSLFVIGEGRWEMQNFPNGAVDISEMTWDFAAQSSNYSELRAQALTQEAGRVWLTTYARWGALLSAQSNPAFPGSNITYQASDSTVTNTLAGLYMAQGVANGEKIDPACPDGMLKHASSQYRVVDTCADMGPGGAGGSDPTGGGGGTSGGAGGSSSSSSSGTGATGGTGTGGAGGAGTGGAGGTDPSTGGGGSGTGGSGGAPCAGTVGPDEIDAREFTCGSLDDLSIALVGLHPADVWVTRFEANLPHTALDTDLSLQSEATQGPKDNWLVASGVVNPPCDDWVYSGGIITGGGDKQGPRVNKPRHKPPRTAPRSAPHNHDRELMFLGLSLALFGSAAARRLLRPSLRGARASR